MNKEELMKYVKNEIDNGRNTELNYEIKGIKFKINFICPDDKKGINIPSIIAIPCEDNFNNQIILESNNMESDSFDDILEQGIQTAIKLVTVTKDRPGTIVIPLIPSYKNAPYFQQLSRECFELEPSDKNYRIENQILKIIEYAKKLSEKEKGILFNNRIFLNGYSSSGVFAQRFALLHPEVIDIVCIGGASGSIPIPSDEIEYPIGIKDYENISGKRFDLDQYKNIKFRYYVGELEIQDKTNTRFTDDGSLAPMHDMSYFDRSVPTEVGKKQREILGQEMFERATKTIQLLNSLGIDISQAIFEGRTHNNRCGQGVNELGDKFVNEVYKEMVINKERNQSIR